MPQVKLAPIFLKYKVDRNVFVPGQKHTLLGVPAEVLLMILYEHFSGLEVKTRRAKDVESARISGINPATKQKYLGLALVNTRFYRLCLPLLYEHAIFHYTATYSENDMRRIAYQLNISLRVRVIRTDIMLARRIASLRAQMTHKPFPKLKHFIVREKVTPGEEQNPYIRDPIGRLLEPAEDFRKQGVSYEAYITINGESSGLPLFKGKKQRIRFGLLNSGILRLFEAEYVLPSAFDKWNAWIERECKQKLHKPDPSLSAGLICYKDKTLHWEG